ncbi:hypothetical protein [Actinospica robiniae]|nr:hypothetical protein [Actinospica robiniae]
MSGKHTAIRLLGAKDAVAALQFDSNRTALGELDERLTNDDQPEAVA